MPKLLSNSFVSDSGFRATLLTLSNRVNQDLNKTSSVRFQNLTLTGDLHVLGQRTVVESNIVTFRDELLEVNAAADTSDPALILGKAGLKIRRRNQDAYIVWDETTLNFRVGLGNALDRIATIEDTPGDQLLGVWDNSAQLFRGTDTIEVPVFMNGRLTVALTDNATSLSSGSLVASGGIAVNKSIACGERLTFYNGTNGAAGPYVEGTTVGDLRLATAGNLMLEATNVRLDADHPLWFGPTAAIYADSLNNNDLLLVTGVSQRTVVYSTRDAVGNSSASFMVQGGMMVRKRLGFYETNNNNYFISTSDYNDARLGVVSSTEDFAMSFANSEGNGLSLSIGPTMTQATLMTDNTFFLQGRPNATPLLTVHPATNSLEATSQLRIPDFPTDPLHAVSSSYVTHTVHQFPYKVAVDVATVGSVSMQGGVGLVVDGVVMEPGVRILVHTALDPVDNGVYVVNTTGSVERATDFSGGWNASGALVFVLGGTEYGKSGWLCPNASGTATVGVHGLVFEEVTGMGQIVAGTGLIQTQRNTLNVKASQPHIDEVGVVQGGEWRATAVDVAYGGTSRTSLPRNRLLVGNDSDAVVADPRLTFDPASGTLTVNATFRVTNSPIDLGIVEPQLTLTAGQNVESSDVACARLFTNAGFAELNASLTVAATSPWKDTTVELTVVDKAVPFTELATVYSVCDGTHDGDRIHNITCTPIQGTRKLLLTFFSHAASIHTLSVSIKYME